MDTANLTREETAARSAAVSVRHIRVELDLTGAPERSRTGFPTITTLEFSSTAESTWVDFIGESVDRVVVNGVDQEVDFDGARIALRDLTETNIVRIEAVAAYSRSGEGMHRFHDPADDRTYLYTQYEPADSRRVMACFEQPDLKAPYTFVVDAPAGWEVLSNQAAVKVDVGVGVQRVEFAPTLPISSYITSVAAGPYARVDGAWESEGQRVALGVFARRSLAQYLESDEILEITRQGLDFFTDAFASPYPWGKYDQIFVPEYNLGAMENPGLVTFTEAYLARGAATEAQRAARANTILHEMAHMWFGDLVTMKWWDDLWLKESFADYMGSHASAVATRFHDAWVKFAANRKAWAYQQDQLPTTHPIVADITDLEAAKLNFDGITYAKGGSVLKQLAAWVGIEQFFAGVAAYFQKHQWSNTEVGDLLVELEATSGRDLGDWSKKWLETAGVNTLTPLIEEGADGTISRFAIVQTAPADYPTIRPHRLGVGFYSLNDAGTLERVHHVEIDVDGDRTEVPELRGIRRPDLVLLNDNDLAYAKIRLDERSLATAIAHLKDIADPLARSLVWGAAWDQTRDAEASATDYLDLVLRNIGSETESTTVRTTLAQLQLAANSYVAPAKREASRQRVADGLWELAQAAEAGSDSQLQFVTAFASAASTPAHAETVRALRAGEIALDGLEIDTDLSWQLLVSLASAGAVTAAEIDEARAADNTAKGGEFAAMAKASLPSHEAKQEAWDSLIERTDAPNTIVRSTAAGFTNPATVDVLADFVEPYFAMLLPIWESRSYQIANYLIVGLYPAALASTALRDATRGWLARNTDAAPALRRLVSENLAGVERALAVQERDAA